MVYNIQRAGRGRAFGQKHGHVFDPSQCTFFCLLFAYMWRLAVCRWFAWPVSTEAAKKVRVSQRLMQPAYKASFAKLCRAIPTIESATLIARYFWCGKAEPAKALLRVFLKGFALICRRL
jgi:hypothetical protein